MQGHLGERKLRSQVKRLSQIIGRRTGSDLQVLVSALRNGFSLVRVDTGKGW